MLAGRGDIIGDLARLRNEFVRAEGNKGELLGQLELLAAVAVDLGMSHNIVHKASGIPPERIEAVLDTRPSSVRRLAAQYERGPSGVVYRREEP